MVPTSHILAFAGVVTLLVVIPGPSVIFIISRALTVGRRSAVFTVVGNAIGFYAQAAAVAVGIGALVQRAAYVLTIMKWVGAAYLVYLGVQAIRHRQSMAEALSARITPVRPRRALRDGLIVGVSNPKTIVFFVITLPAFTTHTAGHLPPQLQMLLLGALLPAISLVLGGAWAGLAGAARTWFARSPRRLAVIGGTGGLVMIGLGIGLAATGRHD
jgi:threonine/homoserine/homoserine lactone efflux protein